MKGADLVDMTKVTDIGMIHAVWGDDWALSELKIELESKGGGGNADPEDLMKYRMDWMWLITDLLCFLESDMGMKKPQQSVI